MNIIIESAFIGIPVDVDKPYLGMKDIKTVKMLPMNIHTPDAPTDNKWHSCGKFTSLSTDISFTAELFINSVTGIVRIEYTDVAIDKELYSDHVIGGCDLKAVRNNVNRRKSIIPSFPQTRDNLAVDIFRRIKI